MKEVPLPLNNEISWPGSSYSFLVLLFLSSNYKCVIKPDGFLVFYIVLWRFAKILNQFETLNISVHFFNNIPISNIFLSITLSHLFGASIINRHHMCLFKALQHVVFPQKHGIPLDIHLSFLFSNVSAKNYFFSIFFTEIFSF